MVRTPIALLTDYGFIGPYVGVIKAVILSINPEATIFDLSHDIAPQAVEEGAFVLAQAMPYLPVQTICVAVVDPGVGTPRRGIALRTPTGVFVGPDNGLLSAAFDRELVAAGNAGVTTSLPVPQDCEAVELAKPEYFRHPVSNTFHGRDVFAPVAAHISLGRSLTDLGPSVDTVQAFPPWRGARQTDGSIAGRVIYVDGFGNLVSDIRGEDLSGTATRTQIGAKTFTGLQRTFQDGPEFTVYIGSSGFLEIARRNSSAAAALGAGAGTPLRVWDRAAGDTRESRLHE